MLAAPEVSWRVTRVPAGAFTTTRYVPAVSPVKRYVPSGPVTVARSLRPSISVRVTATPGAPGSPAWYTPSPLLSIHVRPPISPLADAARPLDELDELDELELALTLELAELDALELELLELELELTARLLDDDCELSRELNELAALFELAASELADCELADCELADCELADSELASDAEFCSEADSEIDNDTDDACDVGIDDTDSDTDALSDAESDELTDALDASVSATDADALALLLND